jgi:hypothetical protein
MYGGLTLVYYALESCLLLALAHMAKNCNVRITLNSRADTAAAAMVQRMITRSRPLVFLLVVPRKRGSSGLSDVATAMMAGQQRTLQGEGMNGTESEGGRGDNAQETATARTTTLYSYAALEVDRLRLQNLAKRSPYSTCSALLSFARKAAVLDIS